MIRLTGTFLDEITHDIPSQNWGEKEWRREFSLYQKIGIDSVIIIRAGYQDKCIFPAKSVPGLLPVYEDLAARFLDLAGEYGLKLFFGTFDSGSYWERRSYWKEIELNKKFLDEVGNRYGSHEALAGWYMCHETSRHDAHIVELFNQIGGHAKSIRDLPILISPYPAGTKQLNVHNAMTLEESIEHWDRIYDETKETIDICAFQDGQIQYRELPQFLNSVRDLGAKHGIKIWSNVETFDRDMPIRFPPANWRYLRLKMEEATKTVEKMITFEFAHFMSPYSSYPSAHNLFRRYCEAHGFEFDEIVERV